MPAALLSVSLSSSPKEYHSTSRLLLYCLDLFRCITFFNCPSQCSNKNISYERVQLLRTVSDGVAGRVQRKTCFKRGVLSYLSHISHPTTHITKLSSVLCTSDTEFISRLSTFRRSPLQAVQVQEDFFLVSTGAVPKSQKEKTSNLDLHISSGTKKTSAKKALDEEVNATGYN